MRPPRSPKSSRNVGIFALPPIEAAFPGVVKDGVLDRQALGARVRTNAESLIAVRYPGGRQDLSDGIAIGSGIYINVVPPEDAAGFLRGLSLPE